ncbi:MAG: tetratricopeptide repeat protein [Fluviicola sp.]
MKNTVLFLLGLCFLLFSAVSCRSNSRDLKQAKKYYKQKKYATSLKVLNSCLKSDQNDVNARMLRAQVLLKTGDTAKSIRDYEFVIYDLNAAHVYSYYQLSRVFLAAGQPEDALELINDAFAANGSDIMQMIDRPPYSVGLDKMRFQRALVYYNLGEYQNALNDFDFSQSHRMKDLHYYRGSCLQELGYPQAAREAYQLASDWNSIRANYALERLKE